MNPLYLVERTVKSVARQFYRSVATVTRNGVVVETDMPCLLERDTSALNFDPAADEQPDLGTMYFDPERNVGVADEVEVDGVDTWRVISANRHRTWRPFDAAIMARGGDTTPQVTITVYRRRKDGSVIKVDEYDVYIIYSSRVPQVLGSGTNTRRMGATIISNDGTISLRRGDTFIIEGTQVSGNIANVTRTETGTEAECYITQGFEEPTS